MLDVELKYENDALLFVKFCEAEGIVEITKPKIDFHTNYNPNQKMIGMVNTDASFSQLNSSELCCNILLDH